MIALLACPSCHRHVRAVERTCVFCGHELPPRPPRNEERSSLHPALGRAGSFAVAAGVAAVLVVACETPSIAAYGGPPPNVPPPPTAITDGGAQQVTPSPPGAPAKK